MASVFLLSFRYIFNICLLWVWKENNYYLENVSTNLMYLTFVWVFFSVLFLATSSLKKNKLFKKLKKNVKSKIFFDLKKNIEQLYPIS